MNNSIISKLLISLLISLSFLACKENTKKFNVEGNIINAEKKTLYLEKSSPVVILDSLILTEEGNYKFSAERPKHSDFFRLRIGGQKINFAVDSFETINIKADANNFITNYTITESLTNNKIKDISILQLNAQTEYNKLKKLFNDGQLNTDDYFSMLKETVDKYRNEAIKVIGTNFDSPAAYFALFQQVDNMFLFDIYDRKDRRLFGAVANNYPESPRKEQLTAMYLGAMKDARKESNVEIKEVEGKDLFDISLKDENDKQVKLSELEDKKLILIDFTTYTTEDSPLRNIALNEIYTKYKSKGFEIYQISLDTDEHLWKNRAINLPWVTVIDPQSVNSTYVKTFNITQLPTSFLRNHRGEITARIESISDLENELKKNLK